MKLQQQFLLINQKRRKQFQQLTQLQQRPIMLACGSEIWNAGLQPQTAAFKEEIANLFGITSFSGYRPGDSGDHGKGLAIDLWYQKAQN